VGGGPPGGPGRRRVIDWPSVALLTFRFKSDLRNHQAIVQPRLYDSLMVTQITLKTEGPHGLPSGRQTEVDPLYRGLIILTVYDCGHAFQPHLREVSLCANASTREEGGWQRFTNSVVGPHPPRLAGDYVSSLAGHACLVCFFRKSVPGRDRTRGVPC
jgi:hypothetical protein